MPETAPKLLLTTGEPAGIGPDVVLTAAKRDWPAHLVAVGDRDMLGQRAAALGLDIELVPYSVTDEPQPHRGGRLPLVHIPCKAPVVPGQLDPGNASYVLAMLEYAVAVCRAGECAAMVTAPVQKSVIADAGVGFSGHTEFLRDLTDSAHVVMLLVAGDLRVALATTHLPLSAVSGAITRAGLEQTLRVLDADLTARFGIASPRISVLGLNPHAGEGGHLGREEIDVITPVLDTLRAEGMRLSGPLAADTAFSAERRAATDAYLAMYHDQGLPVLKFAGFGEAVNVTLGLPIVRTSVDHGTALELAGTGMASAGSLCAAIELAAAMAADTARRAR